MRPPVVVAVVTTAAAAETELQQQLKQQQEQEPLLVTVPIPESVQHAPSLQQLARAAISTGRSGDRA